jgi:PAS domain S-box-containing protein
MLPTAVVTLQRGLWPLLLLAGVMVAASALAGWEVLSLGRDGALLLLCGGAAVLVLVGRLRRTVGACLASADILNARLQLLARVSRHVGSPVLVTDPAGLVVWVNEAFERETGYPSAQVLGTRPGRRLRSPLADPQVVDQVRAAMLGQSDIDVELLHRYRDEKDRWVRLILTAQRDDQGQFSGFVVVMVDVDQQVRTREAYRKALRDRDALFSALDGHMTMAETDAEGRFTRVNRRFVELSGYDETDLIGQGFDLLGSGWHPPSFWRSLWQRVEEGKPWQGEICHRNKAGRLYWTQTLVTPFRDDEGRLDRLVFFQNDVSEHRRARIELSKSQSLLTRTSRLAGVGGWYAAPSGTMLHMTPECRQLLGIGHHDAVDLGGLWRVFAAGARLVVRQRMEQLLAGALQEVDLVAPVNRSSGASAQWVKMVVSFGETDPDGSGRTVRRLIGAVQDYTAQVQAQQRIREEQRILHSAMDAVGEAFALFDAHGRLVYYNDAQAAWLPDLTLRVGMRHEDMLRSMADLGLFRDAIGRESEWVSEVLRAPQRSAPDRIRQMADGRWFRFVDRITTDGQRVVLRYDVTELQGALIRADAAVAGKEQFLANMSHEIRTPINAVTGMLQLLADTPLDATQTDMVAKARLAARSLLGIINDILDFSKIRADKMDLDPMPFRLAELRRELEVVLEGARGRRALELHFETDPSVPPVLVGDHARLRQVLINLGGNAVKFTPQGRVTLGWRRLSLGASSARVRFFVKDTGIGIASAKQASVFDSFSQGEASTNRRFGGSGLGLAISQHLVRLMGGHIELESEPDVGSLFWFDIELAVGSESDLSADADGMAWNGQGPPLAGVRILLAEDNELNQEVAMALLGKVGARVTLVSNGLQAIEALRVDPGGFDVVLMDVQMPVLDGLRATECIRDGLKLDRLPVLAMTANATVADREACLKAGMDAHIAKPFDLHEVVQAVRQLLDRPAASRAPLSVADSAASEPVALEDTVALQRLGGDRVLLLKLRSRFIDSASQLLAQANACLARGDHMGVAGVMHQLKSSAAVVGAGRLAQRATWSEAQFRQEAPSLATGRGREALDPVAQALAEVRTCLAQSAGAGDPPQAAVLRSPGDLDAVNRSIEALKPLYALFKASDMEALDAHEAWLRSHPAAQDERFSNLNACVDRLDLDGAAQACASLFEAIESSGRSLE